MISWKQLSVVNHRVWYNSWFSAGANWSPKNNRTLEELHKAFGSPFHYDLAHQCDDSFWHVHWARIWSKLFLWCPSHILIPSISNARLLTQCLCHPYHVFVHCYHQFLKRSSDINLASPFDFFSNFLVLHIPIMFCMEILHYFSSYATPSSSYIFTILLQLF